MAKRPAISKPPKSEEFQTFERDLRKVLSVSKKDARVEAEKRARANGNGASH